MNEKRSITIKWIVIGIVAIAVIIVPFLIFGERIDMWTEQLVENSQYNRGIIALILGSLLGSDILLPIPSSIASTACGLLLGVVGGTLVSLVGMTLSCVIGYFLAAKLGQPFVAKMVGDNSMNQFTKLQNRYGNWVVVITRPVPVLAEIAVLSAGLGQIPFWRFLWISTLSNLGISIVYATIGAYSSNLNSFFIAVAGSMVLPGIGMLVMHIKSTPISERRLSERG